jgi:hypothetical protein
MDMTFDYFMPSAFAPPNACAAGLRRDAPPEPLRAAAGEVRGARIVRKLKAGSSKLEARATNWN